MAMVIYPARMEDAQVLFDWRNDSLTRAMSRNQKPVEWEGHLAWLTERLSREAPRLYIAEKSGKQVGTFRIDDGKVSYTIAPEERGKGYGFLMLSKAREMFGTLTAEIYERNIPSIKIAERSGMTVQIITD